MTAPTPQSLTTAETLMRSPHAVLLQSAIDSAQCPEDAAQFEAHLENLYLSKGAALAKSLERS